MIADKPELYLSFLSPEEKTKNQLLRHFSCPSFLIDKFCFYFLVVSINKLNN